MKRRTFIKRAAIASYIMSFGLPSVVMARAEKDRQARLIALIEKKTAEAQADMAEQLNLAFYYGGSASGKTDSALPYAWKQVVGTVTIT